MAKLAPLNLKITGSANGLSAALGKSQKDVQGFAAGIQGKLSSMLAGLSANPGTAVLAAATAGLAALTAGALAAKQAISSIIDQINGIDAIAEQADKLALSFTELSGLRFTINEGSGLDNAAIDKSLQKFQLNLAEAGREGAGKVFEALARVGLNAGDLLKAGPVEALKQIADATAALESPTDQLLLAYELFGKQGAGLVSTLRGGRDAIEESYNFATKQLGVSQDLVRVAQQFNDNMGRIQAVITGIAQTVSIELAPAFLIVTEEILGAAAGMDTLRVSTRAFFDSLAESSGIVFDLGDGVLKLNESVGALFSGNLKALPGLVQEAFTFDSGEKFLKRIDETRKKFSDAAAKKPQKGLSPEEEATVEKIEELTKTLDTNAKVIERWKSVADSITKSLATPEEKYRDRIEELSQAALQGGLDFETFGRGVRKAFEELQQLNGAETDLRADYLKKGSKEEADFLRKTAKPESTGADAEVAKLTARLIELQEQKESQQSANATVANEKLGEIKTELEKLNSRLANKNDPSPLNL